MFFFCLRLSPWVCLFDWTHVFASFSWFVTLHYFSHNITQSSIPSTSPYCHSLSPWNLWTVLLRILHVKANITTLALRSGKARLPQTYARGSKLVHSPFRRPCLVILMLLCGHAASWTSPSDVPVWNRSVPPLEHTHALGYPCQIHGWKY